MDPIIKERKFTLEDQNIFAKLSGDYNNMHLDEIAARRYLFGGLVVHGMHMLLWVLDKWLETFRHPIGLVSLKVSFQRPLPVGESVKYRLNKDIGNHIELELYGAEQVYIFVKAEWEFIDTQKEVGNLIKDFPPLRECRVLTAQELEGTDGQLDLYIEEKTISTLFPSLFKRLPLIQIAQLLATTRLIGMECPGFHSIFFELNVIFSSMTSAPYVLKYKVVNFDNRFSLSVIDVKGPSMQGNLQAFLRPAPRRQASLTDISKIVSPDEFQEQRALIIGGSRGLGEVVSKLLIAGGASIVFTYFKGHDDARKIANEIISQGQNVDIAFFNVLNPEDTLVDKLVKLSPTHLYYFATPFITGGREEFSSRMFKNFYDYYVSGFFNTLKFLLKITHSLKKVFYPSTIFVQELPLLFAEYSAAKAAGEVLCSFLEKTKNISIYKPRLPKMATDQTVSLKSEFIEDPVPIMLKQLRDFMGYSR